MLLVTGAGVEKNQAGNFPLTIQVGMKKEQYNIAAYNYNFYITLSLAALPDRDGPTQ